MSNTRLFQGEEEEEDFIVAAVQVQFLPTNLRSAQLMQAVGRAAQARRKGWTSSSATTTTAQQSQQSSSTTPINSIAK